MKIVGCDLHTRYQQIAMLEEETGELIERRLEHESGEARAFYAGLASPVRVGIEGGWPMQLRPAELTRVPVQASLGPGFRFSTIPRRAEK